MMYIQEIKETRSSGRQRWKENIEENKRKLCYEVQRDD